MRRKGQLAPSEMFYLVAFLLVVAVVLTFIKGSVINTSGSTEYINRITAEDMYFQLLLHSPMLLYENDYHDFEAVMFDKAKLDRVANERGARIDCAYGEAYKYGCIDFSSGQTANPYYIKITSQSGDSWTFKTGDLEPTFTKPVNVVDGRDTDLGVIEMGVKVND